MGLPTCKLLESSTGGRWLASCDPECSLSGVGIDTREDLSGRIFFAIRGERFDGHDFTVKAAEAGARVIVVDRAIDLKNIPEDVGVFQVAETTEALGRFAAAYRALLTRPTFIAITGSAGKTTTKRLVDAVLGGELRGHAAPRSFNNHIGVPLTLLGAMPDDDIVVVEIGANAPGEIAALAAIARPDIAIITMIGHGHLEGFGTLQTVATEKCALLDFVSDTGVAIVNTDSPLIQERLPAGRRVVTFGGAPSADLRVTNRGRDADGWWFEVNGTRRFPLGLPGAHNATNALAAVAVAGEFGIDDAAIARGLASVEPEPMRMTCIRIGDLSIYNDAYNANPDSLRAALDTFAEVAGDAPRRVAILGDMLELGPMGPALHRAAGRYILEQESTLRLDRVITIGPLAADITRELALAWPPDRLTMIEAMGPDVARLIGDQLRPGDAVLLKASRGVALERLIDELHERHASTIATTPC